MSYWDYQWASLESQLEGSGIDFYDGGYQIVYLSHEAASSYGRNYLEVQRQVCKEIGEEFGWVPTEVYHMVKARSSVGKG